MKAVPKIPNLSPSDLNELGSTILGHPIFHSRWQWCLRFSNSRSSGQLCRNTASWVPSQPGSSIVHSTELLYINLASTSHPPQRCLENKQFYPESSELISFCHTGPEPTPPARSERAEAAIPRWSTFHRLIGLCALSCECTDPILFWHPSQPTC